MKTFLLLFIENKWHSIDIHNFSHYNDDDQVNYTKGYMLITFQTSDLIRKIKSTTETRKKPPTIIDLRCIDKQMSQEGKEFRRYDNWKIIPFLKYHKALDDEFQISLTNLKPLLEKIAESYNKLINKDLTEFNRLANIEIPINEIIYQRQSKGIKIDSKIAEENCQLIEKEIYKIKNILQLEYNIYSPEQINQQLAYIKSKKYKIVNSPLHTFKSHRYDDIICNYFYQLIRSIQDLESYIYIISQWGGSERTHPTFYGFGTITSRIILKQPALQNIRKINRCIIIPDENKKLLYIDYSQFEAGILASLSDDNLLISLYNSDIYKDLAEKVLSDASKRSEAKTIFYRYMYGDDSIDSKAKKYFSNFKKLNELKKNVEAKIIETNKIGTKEGNFRLSNNEDSSWALSHLIQGTASLIYKKALIRTKIEIRSTDFLIPMHDGTLYQIEEYAYEERKEQIIKIYKEEFKKACPQIEPKISCADSF